MYTVYKHTAPNGKVYVGMTGNIPEKRWSSGRGYRNNEHFYNAILKYGWENIRHEIVLEGLTKGEAEAEEIRLIGLYKSNDAAHGYNIENGGNCAGKMSNATKEKIRNYQKKIVHKPLSDTTKKKISEGRKGIRPNREYKPIPEELKKIISAKCKGRKMSQESIAKRTLAQTGLKRSDETRRKISESNKGRVSPNKGVAMSEEQKTKIGKSNGKLVFCIDLNTVFDSCHDAGRKTGVNYRNISLACNGKRKTAGGYRWEYIGG